MLNPKEWTVISKTDVRWGDMDSFNHVNNTIYFRYFETARIDYFRHIHWHWLKNKVSNKIGPILAQTSCQFIQPVTFPDDLTIGVRATKLGRTSIVQEYVVYSDKLGLVAKGEGVVVCYDFQNNTKIEFPPELKKRILEAEVLDLSV